MLMNWPARYDPFLMQHVKDAKYHELKVLKLRFDRIDSSLVEKVALIEKLKINS